MTDILPGMVEAVAALNRGDVEAVAALMDDDVDWRGPSTGHLWWRHTPGCHGREEARANLQHLVSAAGGARVELEGVERIGDRLVVHGRRTGAAPGSRPQEFFQVVTVRAGRIVAMQGCRSRRAALRLARQGRRRG